MEGDHHPHPDNQKTTRFVTTHVDRLPSTVLDATSETVSHYYRRTGKDNSSSRAYRNNLEVGKKSKLDGLKSQMNDKNKNK